MAEIQLKKSLSISITSALNSNLILFFAKCLTSVLFVITYSTIVQAQETIISEFVFVLSKKDSSRINDDKPLVLEGKVKEKLPKLSFSKPYKTNVSEIKVSMSYQVQTLSPLNESGVYPFFAYLVAPKIEIDKIQTKDQIKEKIGNITANVKVEGFCNSLSAQYTQGYLPINGNIKIDSKDGKLNLSLSDLKISYNKNSWELDFKSCSGPRGYAEILKSNIQNYLKDSHFITEMLKNGIETQLNSKNIDINNQIMKTQSVKLSESIQLNLVPQRVDKNHSDNLYVYGQLSIEFKDSKNNGMTFVSFEKLNLDKIEETMLIIPQALIQKILSGTYKNGYLQHTQYSNDIKGLSELTRSRFKQFFAWPDLMNFRKDTNYLFFAYAYSEPKVSELSVENSNMGINFSTDVVNHMYYPVGSDYKPYVNFYSLVTSKANISLVTNGLQVQLNNTNLDPQYSFDEEYRINNNPQEYIDVQTLASHLVEELQGHKFEYNLSPLDLNLVGKFKPNSFSLVDNQVRILYSK